MMSFSYKLFKAFILLAVAGVVLCGKECVINELIDQA